MNLMKKMRGKVTGMIDEMMLPKMGRGTPARLKQVEKQVKKPIKKRQPIKRKVGLKKKISKLSPRRMGMY